MRRISVLRICSILLALVASFNVKDTEFEGTHTANIKGYQVLVPIQIGQDGAFLSYSLPHFYDCDTRKRKKRNAPNGSEKVHYGLTFNDKSHHVEMWPNNDFMSQELVIEEWGSDAAVDVKKVTISPVNNSQCHYTGLVRGRNGSRLALSVCDGLSGYIKINQGKYFIEPLKGQEPQSDGKHVHAVYKASEANPGAFGTGGCEEGWRKRLRWKHWGKRDAQADLKTDATQNIKGKHWYLDLLAVADKRFLDYHNNSDPETYILTTMYMAADLFHIATMRNLDIVVVRIINLHKQEEELDLHINQDAYTSLDSFCKWQMTVNPRVETHANHHDIAVLLMRVNICANKTTGCSKLGAA